MRTCSDMKANPLADPLNQSSRVISNRLQRDGGASCQSTGEKNSQLSSMTSGDFTGFLQTSGGISGQYRFAASSTITRYQISIFSKFAPSDKGIFPLSLGSLLGLLVASHYFNNARRVVSRITYRLVPASLVTRCQAYAYLTVTPLPYSQLPGSYNRAKVWQFSRDIRSAIET